MSLMDKIFEKLNHYHDTGEHAISRGLEIYKPMVFKDEGSGWLRKKPIDMHSDNPAQWTMRHYHTLKHYLPVLKGDKLFVDKDNSIQYEWDWREDRVFGGFDNFFADGSSVIDLGSGKGVAVKEINEKFINKNVKCVGVDYRYSQEPPENNKSLKAGDFANLPFEGETFNRILSVESFPCWLPEEEQAINRYIEEITRVSQVGTIWRGTLPTYEDEEEIRFPTDMIVRKFVKHGWEVIICGGFFVGKLLVKTKE